MAEQDEDLLKNLQEKSLELSLFKARKIFLWSDVNDESAKAVVTRLLSLANESADEEIVIFINSPGGSIHDGLAVYDAMQAISAPVSTVCMGLAASMGAMLLARVRRLVFGTRDLKAGAALSLYRMAEDPRLNHRMQVLGGVLEEQCSAIVSDFFRQLRAGRKGDKDQER